MDKLEVHWNDRQPSIGRESDYLVQTEMFQDLYSLVAEYGLISASLDFVEKKISGEDFRLTICGFDRNPLPVIVARLGRCSNESFGEVNWIPPRNWKTLNFHSLEGIKWFEQENPLDRRQRELVSSNLSEDLQSVISKHSAKSGLVKRPSEKDSSRYQYLQLDISGHGNYWFVNSSYVDEGASSSMFRCVSAAKLKEPLLKADLKASQ